ncbi:MAG: DUF2490 domain-containing protein [Bacteroidota bacterium]
MKNIFLLFLGILCANLLAYGQSPRQFYNIANGWTDLNISGTIKSKFTWQIENQHRRVDMQGENNPATVTGNPYNNLNQHIFRPYIHFQANPNIRFSVMPLGWMGSNRFKDGKPSAFFSELRVSPQVILTQNLRKLRLDSRLRYEFRWLGLNEDPSNHSGFYGGDFSTVSKRQRFRYQLKGTIPLNHDKMDDKTLYAQAYNELFINMGKEVPTINLLDQNRFLIGLGYKYNQYFSFEAGFLRQSFYRFNNADKNNIDRNNTLQLNLILNNVEKMLKKTNA